MSSFVFRVLSAPRPITTHLGQIYHDLDHLDPTIIVHMICRTDRSRSTSSRSYHSSAYVGQINHDLDHLDPIIIVHTSDRSDRSRSR